LYNDNSIYLRVFMINKTIHIITLFLVLLIPVPAFSLGDYHFHRNIDQGNTGLVLITSSSKIKNLYTFFNKRKLLGKNIYFSKNKYIYRILVPTSPLTKTGQYTLNIFFNNKKQKQLKIIINKSSFKKTIIQIPKKKKGLLRSPGLNKEAALIGAKFKEHSDTPYWRNQFILPVKGRLTSTYGNQRTYNNGIVTWWHKGIDIGSKLGTAIVAPNDGTISLTATTFEVHGNTVMIDHGHGVVSVFNHMQSIKVKAGQFIQKGQKIGTVGSTGLSTGPHVHWGLSVNNIRVNPLQWVENRFAPNYFK